MMKFFSTIVILFSIITGCFSQTQKAGTDSTFTFSEVVIADSLSKDLLYKNAFNWLLHDTGKGNVIVLKDSTGGKIQGHASFIVYSQSGVLSKISGRIDYNFSIEVKDGKYRYAFSDFLYYYYKQDRYYNMVATGMTKPLTELKAKGWQKLWDHHRESTITRMNGIIADMKTRIIFKGSKAKEKEKKVEW